jgi:predicted transcriptional regulator
VGKKILSQHEKYRKAFSIAQKIATVASEASGKQFDERLSCLKKLLGAWQESEEVKIEISQEKNAPSIDEFKETLIESKPPECTQIGTESDQHMPQDKEIGSESSQHIPRDKAESNNSNN